MLQGLSVYDDAKGSVHRLMVDMFCGGGREEDSANMANDGVGDWFDVDAGQMDDEEVVIWGGNAFKRLDRPVGTSYSSCCSEMTYEIVNFLVSPFFFAQCLQVVSSHCPVDGLLIPDQYFSRYRKRKLWEQIAEGIGILKGLLRWTTRHYSYCSTPIER